MSAVDPGSPRPTSSTPSPKTGPKSIYQSAHNSPGHGTHSFTGNSNTYPPSQAPYSGGRRQDSTTDDEDDGDDDYSSPLVTPPMSSPLIKRRGSDEKRTRRRMERNVDEKGVRE
ncbi:unnamed protein product, partial [Lymnaea stagnalis]